MTEEITEGTHTHVHTIAPSPSFLPLFACLTPFHPIHPHTPGNAMDDLWELNLEEKRWRQIIQPPSSSSSSSLIMGGGSRAASAAAAAAPAPAPAAAAAGGVFPGVFACCPPLPLQPPPAPLTHPPNNHHNTGGGHDSPSAAGNNGGNGRPLPGPRFCHVAVVWRHSLFIFGGYDGSARLGDLLEFKFGPGARWFFSSFFFWGGGSWFVCMQSCSPTHMSMVLCRAAHPPTFQWYYAGLLTPTSPPPYPKMVLTAPLT